MLVFRFFKMPLNCPPASYRGISSLSSSFICTGRASVAWLPVRPFRQPGFQQLDYDVSWWWLLGVCPACVLLSSLDL